jgi:hypothetical protein
VDEEACEADLDVHLTSDQVVAGSSPAGRVSSNYLPIVPQKSKYQVLANAHQAFFKLKIK